MISITFANYELERDRILAAQIMQNAHERDPRTRPRERPKSKPKLPAEPNTKQLARRAEYLAETGKPQDGA